MASYPDLEQIHDEDALESLINETEDIEFKRRIRRRQRNIREKRLAEYEAERQVRFQPHTAEDAVTHRLRMAEEDKARKLREFEEHARLRREAVGVAEEALQLRQAQAEEEKQRKLENYRQMGKIMSTVYNTGVNDLLKAKNQPTNDLDMNSFNYLTNDPRASTAVTGFGGTSYGSKTTAAPRQDTSNQNAISRNPTAIKQMLLDWSKAQTDGYQNVNVTNFSSSWNDGLAFCALIHHFYPDAFDFNQLNPKNRRGNFTLAFSTAEKRADIMPLLDVEDMVRMKNPDWKCVFTYVQSFYRRFATQKQ